jgi:hypothetical protein
LRPGEVKKLVTEYRTFINGDITRRIEPKKEYEKKIDSKSSFEIKQDPNEIIKPNSFLKIDYIASKNYFANRYKLSNNKEQNTDLSPFRDPLKKFQILSKQASLPQAYSVSFTTFYDLVKPKPALSKSVLYKDDAYFQAKKSADKKTVLDTYVSNQLYFQRSVA